MTGTLTPEYITKTRALLAELGNTPNTIATALHTRGIVGEQASAYRCPLARYLAPHFPHHLINICGMGVGFYHWRTPETHPLTYIDGFMLLTTPQAQFAVQFDHGAYPQLIHTPTP